MNGKVRAAIVVSASYREWLGTASGWQHSDTRGGPRQAWAVTVPSSRYKSLARILKSKKKKGQQGKEKRHLPCGCFTLEVCVMRERVSNRAEPLEVKLTRPSSIKRIQGQPPVGSGCNLCPPALALKLTAS